MTGLPRWAVVLLCLAAAFAAPRAAAAPHYAVRGMVVAVNRPAKTFTASIEAIPGYMPAMTMPFAVRQTGELDALAPGAIVEFTLIVESNASHAEQIRVVPFENVQQDPFSASRLTLLQEIVSGAAPTPLATAETVPDFRLTDQTRRPVALSTMRGKVVAINFVYTSCVLPEFCLRFANNFAVLQKRFRRQLGRDLVLLTITFDPVHDTPEVLSRYAGRFNADAAGWHFLTGPEPEIQRLCHLFGVHAFPDEGLMDHSLHTVLIDRQGRLVANIEGNQFTAAQLGDLTERVLR
jgi:protein SCO1/2